jgi:hypothetical protein
MKAHRTGLKERDGGDFETERICCHCREMVIPQPLNTLFRRLDSDECTLSGGLLLLLLTRLKMPLCKPCAKDENVSIAKLRALILGHRFQLFYGDGSIRIDGNGRLSGLLAPSTVIQEDTTSDNATSFDPLCERRCVIFLCSPLYFLR